ncbi:MAG: aldo/keto reductase [Paraglaciecola sp.]|uniref:aldo/keto reductase n=1 Tax=Paraglaciecola sp. TaxID=1920173 RepID=UPI003297A2DC
MTNCIESVATLNNGLQMPWLGLGTFTRDSGQAIQDMIADALSAGFRSIDTASIYKNEVSVGNALKNSEVARKDIFLTTKVWNEDQRKRRTLQAFEESLKRLGTDYVDLYLIHWPVADCYLQTWQVMEEIYRSGRAKAIGVSNFLIPHLEDILQNSDTVPCVNQIEFHPYLTQTELIKYCQNNKIQVAAWSPLMQGLIASEATLLRLAKKYKKTPAQIVLRWDLQHQVVTIPKSVTTNRIIENTQIFDFELSDQDMSIIDALNQDKHLGPDPANFDF